MSNLLVIEKTLEFQASNSPMAKWSLAFWGLEKFHPIQQHLKQSIQGFLLQKCHVDGSIANNSSWGLIQLSWSISWESIAPTTCKEWSSLPTWKQQSLY